MGDTQPQVIEPSFVAELRRALNHLYDWSFLHRSPLLPLLAADQQDDPPAALRRTLLQAIEALKPSVRLAAKAKGWRTYSLLHSRYSEQFTQAETASELGLSLRHLRREESEALQTLAAYLWSHHDLERKWQAPRERLAAEETVPMPVDAETPTQEEELEWLQESLPSQLAAPGEVVKGVMSLVEPLAHRLRVQVDTSIADGLPQVIVQLTPTRQALLNVFATAIGAVPGGRVVIGVAAGSSSARIRVQANASGVAPGGGQGESEKLEMARRLVEISGGALEIVRSAESGRLLAANIILPAEDPVPVLVIDDNVDTLRLLRRYLTNSRYRFVGAPDPEQALLLAGEAHPRIVVLDVMLPQIDGWELLGRLREHPQTRGVPIIVCSILPQEELALDLGAASFLRKPVSRKGLLAALDRQLGRAGRGSR